MIKPEIKFTYTYFIQLLLLILLSSEISEVVNEFSNMQVHYHFCCCPKFNMWVVQGKSVIAWIR